MTTTSASTPRLQGYAQPVLYLDFDGVLHPEDVWRHPGRGIYLGPGGAGHELFENAPLLEELLEPYPKVQVVLSTSWVRALGYSKAVKHLPPGLARRVMGATFHSQMEDVDWYNLLRGRQVERDVARRRPSAWMAIDDTDEGWSDSSREHLVLSDPVEGIRAPLVAARLRERLAAHFTNLF